MKRSHTRKHGILRTVIQTVFGVLFLAISCVLLLRFAQASGETTQSTQNNTAAYAMMDRYDTFVTNTLSDALDGVLSIKKVYWLSDDDLVAPEPNQDAFGVTDDPTTLQWLLDDAAELLDGQDTLFSTDVKILPGSKVNYYLDETIMAITWKQVMDNTAYTICEVKIADPSQFRRFVADGKYASGTQYIPSEMAASVNAVAASNGDFYNFRNLGIVVYDSQLMRTEGVKLDTCFIDANGDLQFLYAGEMTDEQAMKDYVEEHGIRFSLAFGPAMIDNGELCKVHENYPEGGIYKTNARAALCQYDSLHYLLVAASGEPPYKNKPVISDFAKNLMKLGCQKAYNLDGGQSATIIMNDKVMNYVYERQVSDIIYFATAMPAGE